jgi:glutathione S-transferase
MASQDTSLPPEPTGFAGETAKHFAAENSLKLYSGWFCPFVQRAWITLLEKRIPFQYVEINPYNKDPDFLAMNPRGLVPTLAVPVNAAGTVQKPLYESLVICEYLDEAYTDESKHGPRLLPEDPYERARSRLWIDHIGTRIVPLFYKLIQHTPEKDYTMDEARRNLHKGISDLVEEMDPVGPWFLGDSISLVDIALIPWAQRFWLIDHYKNGGVGIPKEGEDEAWWRWRKWADAARKHASVRATMSADERYILAYKRYADDTTQSLVGQATRKGDKLP